MCKLKRRPNQDEIGDHAEDLGWRGLLMMVAGCHSTVLVGVWQAMIAKNL